MSIPMVFHSLQSVLNVLTDAQFINDDNVRRLLTIYNNVLQREKGRYSQDEQKKHPLIIIEGLDATGKTTLTKRLAEKIGADTCEELRQHVFQLRDAFIDNKLLCTAFYALLNYITALQISNILKDKPVVLDRYWYSTTAYGIARAVNDDPEKCVVPPYGDEIYKWPSDLLKPNVVLFVSVRESVRRRRHSLRDTDTDEEVLLKQNKNFRRNVLAVYGNIVNIANPTMEYIEGNMPRDYVFTEAFDKIKHLLDTSTPILL